MNQSWKELEILLIDDGSPDRCPELCDQWARKDSRIHVFHQKNRGLSGARNRGLDACHGEYLLFVDSDDWIAPDLCETTLSTSEKKSADIVVFGYMKYLKSTGKMLPDIYHYKSNTTVNGREAVRMLIQDKLNLAVWNKLYKRSLFHNIRFPEGICYEDIRVTFQLMQKAKTVCFLDSILYYYEKRKDGIMEEGSRENISDLFANEQWSYAFILQYFPEFSVEHRRRLGRAALTACRTAGLCEGTRAAADALREQKLCLSGKEASFFLHHEKIFWLVTDIRRFLKKCPPGVILWKLKWRILFQLFGKKLS